MNKTPPLRLTKHGSAPLSPELPRTPLSAEQQLKALRLVQDQAEQRVNLGMKLFKAAQTHATHQHELIQELKAHQEQMRQEMQHDIAASLQTYDQWMATFDENFTRKLHQLEEKIDQKIDALNEKWETTQQRIVEMVRRSETLLDQSRRMLKTAAQQSAAPARRTKPPSKPSDSATACTIVVPATQKFLPRPKPRTPAPAQAQTAPQTSTATVAAASTTSAPTTSNSVMSVQASDEIDDRTANIFDIHDSPPNESAPPQPSTKTEAPPSDDAPESAPEQPDMVFSKALEYLKAEQANNPPQDD